MIRGIHHVALNTPDLERLARWYIDVIGFQEVGRAEWADNEFIDSLIGVKGSAAKTVMLRAGNCHLEIFEYSKPASREGGRQRPHDYGYTHFALDVVDIDKEFDRLSAAGMTFGRRPGEMGDIKAIYGKDPDGNIVELQETTPDQAFSMKRLGRIEFS